MRLLVLLFALPLASWACAPPGQDPVSSSVWERVPVSIELRLAAEEPAPGLTAAVVYGEGDTVYLHPTAELSNEEITHATSVVRPQRLVLSLWLTEEGMNRFAAVKASHGGKHLAVVINSVVVGPPPIIAPPPEGIVDTVERTLWIPLQVAVPLPPEEASQLAEAVSETWPTPESRNRDGT